MSGLRTLLVTLTLFTIMLAFTAPALAQGGMMPLERSGKGMTGALADTKDTSMAASIMKASGLDDIATPGEAYTLFVASDGALKATSPGVMSSMTEKLKDRQFATYFVRGHLVSGRIMPGEMADGRTLDLMNGKTMAVKKTDGRLMVDDASIVKAVETNDGVIYVMDRIPSSIKAMLEEPGR